MSWRGLVDWIRARRLGRRGDGLFDDEQRLDDASSLRDASGAQGLGVGGEGGRVQRDTSAPGAAQAPLGDGQAGGRADEGGAGAVRAELAFSSPARPRLESLMMRAPLGRWFLGVPLWARLVSATVVGGVCVTLIAVPAFVRSAVKARCERHQLSCQIGAVKFGFVRLWLRDVSVDDPGLPLGRARLNSVEVRPVWWGVALRVYGGRFEVKASEEGLRARLREIGSRGENASGESASSGGRSIHVEGVDVTFRDSSMARAAHAWGVRALRNPNGWFIAADVAEVSHQRVHAKLRGIELSVSAEGGKGRRLQRVEVASAALRVDLPVPQEPEEVTPKRPASSSNPATRAKGKKRRGVAGPVATPIATPLVAPTSPAPPPEEARANSALLWAALRSPLSNATTTDFNSSVVALTLEAQRGGESLRFGPSRFAVKRDTAGFSLELVPLPQGGRAEATPLTMRLRLPLDEAKPELDLEGGPISLSALGVREGDLGLVGVRDARLEASLHATVAEDDVGFDITSHGLLENVRLRRPALAPNELSGIRLGWQLQGRFKGSDVSLEQAQLSLGDVRLRLAGTVSRSPDHTTVNMNAEVPQAACGSVLAAVPHGMAPMLEALRVEGTLALRGRVDFDSRQVDATRINLEVNNQCRIAGVPPAISPNRFRDAWWREVKGADGLPTTIQSGPGSPDWTAYEEISPYLETAILVCEDAGFFAHRGIDYRAIENSIRMNLEAGRFLRGGSTVTMQLAKNLYLSKEKTLSRKFQEAVFTQLLEQELSKHELMELYLNVIEFGPGIYGVRQAARYYFNEEPRDLSLGQALYLASILPAPDTQHFAPDGRVKDGWAGYLRKLMHIARKIRRISEEELQAGLSEQIAFRKPSERVSPLGLEEDADDAPSEDDKFEAPVAP